MKDGLKIAKLKTGQSTDGLGKITFGKSRPCKTKFVLIDINYDEKAGNALFKAGMELLAKDKDAVIEYAIKTALNHTAKENKCKK